MFYIDNSKIDALKLTRYYGAYIDDLCKFS